MKSDGQKWALEQLRDIARESGNVFEMVEVVEPREAGEPIDVTVSIDCRSFPRKEGGIPLRPREGLRIVVPAAFPLARPSVHFAHKAYGDFPHVQWGDTICLHQAPDVEWQPSQGMLGFMQRLNDWLQAGAANELDPSGLPLHPPIAYAKTNFAVVPREDTPKPEPPFWGGFVEIIRESEVVAELGRWIEFAESAPDGKLATAILLPGSMPHEYPATMFDLITALIDRGVPLNLIKTTVDIGVLSTPPGQPALFLLGAAMRGIAGGARFQHLACWRVPPDRADQLRQAVVKKSDDEFCAWGASASVEWCRVLEDRPEAVERRDDSSPSSGWHGKDVAILGCGAIGSAVATILARAGVARLQLYDNAIVSPGILVRQNFPRRDIGYTKCSSLKLTVEAVNPKLEVTSHHTDVVAMLGDVDRLGQLLSADAIIDATASIAVASAFEHLFRQNPKQHPPVFSMCLGHNADFAMMTVAVETAPGLAIDLDRRSKLMLASTAAGRPFVEEFWPTATGRRKLFQPEPGCSSPTFRGSFADVLALVALMTNAAAVWLARPARDRRASLLGINLSGQARGSGRAREIVYRFEPDMVLNDPRHGFEIRLSCTARDAMLAWIRRSDRVNGDNVETGGVLFGAIDEFLKVIWIDEATGPPPDSVASTSGFLCGIGGVARMFEDRQAHTSGTISFVGMWHTHPRSLPIASQTDLRAMRQLLANDQSYLGYRFLMLIVGGTVLAPSFSASVFQRSDYGR